APRRGGAARVGWRTPGRETPATGRVRGPPRPLRKSLWLVADRGSWPPLLQGLHGYVREPGQKCLRKFRSFRKIPAAHAAALAARPGRTPIAGKHGPGTGTEPGPLPRRRVRQTGAAWRPGPRPDPRRQGFSAPRRDRELDPDRRA